MSIISKADLKTKLANKDDFVLLDVRTPEEYKAGNIETSKNVPVQQIEVFRLSDSDFEQKTGLKKPAQDETIITYCKLGGRAATAQDFLTKLGYKNVINYKGSWTEWSS